LILILTTGSHRYTHEELEAERGLDIRVIGYSDLLQPDRRVPATYIFTDLDRVPLWALRDLSKLYRDLRSRGYRVLNDPARSLGRFGLLRGLNRAGINGFDCYRLDSLERPAKWPVFLRLEGDHTQPVSGLLQNDGELDAAIQAALDEGLPRSAMLIIEYAAEPVRPGLFRKLSVFRIGDRLFGATCVHDDQWVVKYGKPAIAPPELYDEEYEFVAGNPFGEVMDRVFDLAGVDYGRADFGLVDGRPQIYEINGNPDLKLRPEPSPAPRRNQSMELFRSNYLDALGSIDTPAEAAPRAH
jgi:hypothetical protein